MELFPSNSNINFMRLRHVTLGLTAFICVAALVLLATKGFNFALDFTGGTATELKFEQPVDVEVNERRRWIACKRTAGVVIVDKQGEDAFMNRGDINADHIVDHEGEFNAGDTVEVRDPSGHEIGRAVVSINNESLDDHGKDDIAIESTNVAILEPPRPNTTH